MLGHSNVAITQKVYVKYDPDYTRNAAERMAGLLK
jgi:integrase